MTGASYAIRLLGGIELRRDGLVLDVPSSAHRLVGFLALSDRQLSRSHVAATLWPEARESQAYGNLRTTVWRLHALHGDMLDVTPGMLGLHPGVWVDTRRLHLAARAFRQHGRLPDPESLLEIRGELLPGCWDYWLVLDRERLRQEALLLLEASTRAHLAAGDTHLATLLALCAVECDPLRESANLLAVDAFLANKDIAGAVRRARAYAGLLWDELAIAPPAPLLSLLRAHADGEDTGDQPSLRTEALTGRATAATPR